MKNYKEALMVMAVLCILVMIITFVRKDYDIESIVTEIEKTQDNKTKKEVREIKPRKEKMAPALNDIKKRKVDIKEQGERYA